MNLEENSYRTIIDNLSEGLYFVDRERTITYWNKAAEKISGFAAEDVVGTKCSDDILNHVDQEGNNLCLNICPLARSINDGEIREDRVYMRHKNGQRILVSVRTSAIRNSNGEVIGGAELFTDISQQEASKHKIQELEKLILVDSLTKIPNRKYMENEIEKRIREYERLQIPFGILFMDIDHFKIFNDTHGHEIGDEILKSVAATMIASARPFDTFGRWGGEEFLAVIPNINLEALASVAERVRVLIMHTYLANNKDLGATLSIGGTVWSQSDTMQSLIFRADKLMYESKSAGRNRVTTG